MFKIKGIVNSIGVWKLKYLANSGKYLKQFQ